jgi:hypothetical protein
MDDDRPRLSQPGPERDLGDQDDVPCGWHYWRGVSGLFYARRKLSSPPVVLRAETLDGLRKQVLEYLAARERP